MKKDRLLLGAYTRILREQHAHSRFKESVEAMRDLDAEIATFEHLRSINRAYCDANDLPPELGEHAAGQLRRIEDDAVVADICEKYRSQKLAELEAQVARDARARRFQQRQSPHRRTLKQELCEQIDAELDALNTY